MKRSKAVVWAIRIFCLLLVVLMILSLVACGRSGNGTEESDASNVLQSGETSGSAAVSLAPASADEVRTLYDELTAAFSELTGRIEQAGLNEDVSLMEIYDGAQASIREIGAQVAEGLDGMDDAARAELAETIRLKIDAVNNVITLVESYLADSQDEAA